MGDLETVYDNRFSERDAAAKERIWREIARYLQRWFPPDGSILDVACDRGDFIRHVEARQRWATDVRDVSANLPPDVRFVRADGRDLLRVLAPASFDGVFMSNYLEHLPSSDDVVEQLRVGAGLLRPGGRLVILQPNIRHTGPAYWDFIDHRTPLTERSLVEAAEIAGLRTVAVVGRFLPYTTKGRLPTHPLLVRGYLACPPIWRLMGRQTLYVGERP
ncbi:MAG: methyltransferase domain-containing protein [Chloroflexi bacterium]|nr:methyltransferase domain-containing protein [Chloroflexota bacterium]